MIKMGYGTDFYFMKLASVIVVVIPILTIIILLIICVGKGIFKLTNTSVNMILTSAVADENKSATIKCKLIPRDEKFSFIRWYRTADDGKPIGNVLAEIHYTHSNTQHAQEIGTRTNLRLNTDSQSAIYVNETRMSYRKETDDGTYANVDLSRSDVPVIVNSDELDSDSCEEEDRVKNNTLRFLRRDAGSIRTSVLLDDVASTSSGRHEPVYSTVNSKLKKAAPGYMHCGNNREVADGKYKAFMINGEGGLEISKVTLADAGNYTCYVFMTGIVRAKVTSQLSVVQKIRVSINDVNAFENQDRHVDIICKYTPKEEIISYMHWSKITNQDTEVFLASSGKPCRSDRFEATHSPAGVGRLRIRDPVSGDEGRYKCKVIRKNNSAAFYAEGVLTLPVCLFPFHQESSTIITSYRRPAIVSFVQSNRYHLIAFCEKRRRTATKETRSIVTLRGLVRSRTVEWDNQQVTVFSKQIEVTTLQRKNSKINQKGNKNVAWPENPVPIVVNQRRGQIMVLFNTFTSADVRRQRLPDWQLYSAHSTDGGQSWPMVKQHFPWNAQQDRKSGTNLTPVPRHFELSTGHGIKLSTGTLLVNGFASKLDGSSMNDRKLKRHDSSVLAQVILTGGKDGMEWRPIGKLGRAPSSETLSPDTDSTEDVDEELSASIPQDNTHYKESKNSKSFESPGSQAGLVSFKSSLKDGKHSPTWVLCSNPMKSSDKRFSVRLSKDGCNTWSNENLLLKDGRVGSSDLAYFERNQPGSEGTTRMFGCLYESVSKKDGTERLTLVFNTFKLSSLVQDEQ